MTYREVLERIDTLLDEAAVLQDEHWPPVLDEISRLVDSVLHPEEEA